jgi:tripartite-type tricarboxylate transporter receptor subunit TctC
MNSKLISLLRHGLASVLALCTLLVAGHVAAQSVADKYPDKSIKLVIPFPPGGSTDALGRAIAQKMQEKWGQ